MFRMPAPVLSAVAGRHLASLLLLCLAAFTAAAQDGHINGTVLRAGTAPNAAGAPVAGATVTAINQVTTERSTRRTDAGGAFSFKVTSETIMSSRPGDTESWMARSANAS